MSFPSVPVNPPTSRMCDKPTVSRAVGETGAALWGRYNRKNQLHRIYTRATLQASCRVFQQNDDIFSIHDLFSVMTSDLLVLGQQAAVVVSLTCGRIWNENDRYLTMRLATPSRLRHGIKVGLE